MAVVSRVGNLLGLVVLFVLVGAAGFWAGRVALTPPADPLAEEAEPVTYEVVEQTIGQSLQFAAVAEWETEPLARGWASGLVTSVEFVPGDTVDVGDVLFRANLRPVVIGEGQVPAFRDLQAGDSGADVSQLQAMLVTLGFLGIEPDGAFGDATLAAVRDWQNSLGVADDGIVRHGDVVYAAELPVRVVATEALAVGAPLGGGEVVVNGLAPAPSVSIPLTPEQRNLVPLSGAVQLTYPGGTWNAVIARAAEVTEQGQDRLDLILEAPDGGAVCGESCIEWIPPTGRTSFEAAIVAIPETTGPVVPVAAIVTDAGGGQSVRLVDGSEVPIEVIASTGGVAVVSGIEAGDVVVLPFAEPPGS